MELLRITKNVDLIVTGTMSKSGLERLTFGSTAEQLIRNATCPMFTIGPNAVAALSGALVFRSIVYATGFTKEAAQAAAWAVSFATDRGARIYFCHVFERDSSHPVELEMETGALESALKELIPESFFESDKTEFIVAHGSAAKAVVGLASIVDADLMVLGARKASFWLTNIGRGVTTGILAQVN